MTFLLFLKNYWSHLLSIILFILIIIGSFFFGKSLVDNRELKKQKQEYLKVKEEQDVIIEEAQEKIIILQDSIDLLVRDALNINERSKRINKFIRQDKIKTYEKIANIPNLSTDSLLELFSRESEEYQPNQ